MKLLKKAKERVENIHIAYHMKNLFRLAILLVIDWIILIMGCLYVVPHIAGYVAGNLRINYESSHLDIVIWMFCTLFAVGLIFVGALYLIKAVAQAWNRLFAGTIAEGKAIREAKEQKAQADVHVTADSVTVSVSRKKGKRSRKKNI